MVMDGVPDWELDICSKRAYFTAFQPEFFSSGFFMQFRFFLL